MVVTCSIIGDSIAVGLQHAMPECMLNARSGINSIDYAAQLLKPTFGQFVVISLGSNDYKDDLLPALREVRARVMATHVYWLLPNVPRPANIAAVRSVAAEHDDRIISTSALVNRGGVHLTRKGYQTVSAEILADEK